jgi:hypothetical protein
MLDRPAKQNLRVRARASLRLPLSADHRAGGSGERRVSFELDPVLSAELEQVALIEKRTELDLVDGGND